MQIRRTAAALTSAAALSITTVAMATPASAAPNDARQDGLVNVAVQGVVVQLPIAVAANVCDVAVNVLARQLGTGDTTCTAVADPEADNEPGGGPNFADQDGLVNVAVQDLVIQAPIGLAANICNLDVNVLAEQLQTGEAACTAVTSPGAGNG